MNKTVIIEEHGGDASVGRMTPSRKMKACSSTMKIPVKPEFTAVSGNDEQFIHVVCPGLGALRFELHDEPVTIGRGEECAVILPVSSVSREHARITLAGAEYYVEDLGSTNGTFVNNIKIRKCVLRKGDMIKTGEARITFGEEMRSG